MNATSCENVISKMEHGRLEYPSPGIMCYLVHFMPKMTAGRDTFLNHCCHDGPISSSNKTQDLSSTSQLLVEVCKVLPTLPLDTRVENVYYNHAFCESHVNAFIQFHLLSIVAVSLFAPIGILSNVMLLRHLFKTSFLCEELKCFKFSVHFKRSRIGCHI